MSDLERVLGDSLKAVRDDHLRSIEAEIPAARIRIEHKVRRGRLTFVAGGVAVAAAAMAALLFALQALPSLDRAAPIRPVGSPKIVATIDVPGVAFMGTGLGSLWVTHERGIVEIDPASGSIGIESPAHPVDGIALNDEAMFAIDTVGGGISRIPFRSDQAAIATEAQGIPTLVTASDEYVWYSSQIDANDSTAVFALDPGELDYLHEHEFPGVIAADMTESEGSLWLSVSARGTGPGHLEEGFNVVEIPPASNDTEDIRVVQLSEDEGSPAQIAVGDGAVWVLRQANRQGGNTITRVDMETGDVIERAVTLPDYLEDIAFGEGYLWATTAATGMDMPDDVRSRLFRVDPETLEVVGEPLEVAGPGSKLAVGEGYVWVGDPNNKQIVQIDPTGAASPAPTPTDDPSPEPTDDAAPNDPRCATDIPFEPSYSPGRGFLSTQAGYAGQDVPVDRQSPRAVISYVLEEGRHVAVLTEEVFPMLPGADLLVVLDDKARIQQIEDGYAVSFTTGGCGYQLLAYGFGEEEVRRIAEGLVRRGDSTNDAYALWPDSTPEEAYAACLQVSGDFQPFRRDPTETALEFARAVLGWEDFTVDGNAHEGLVRIRSADGLPARIYVQEAAPGCWSVRSVRTGDESQESFLSVGHNAMTQGLTQVSFDADNLTGGRPFATVTLRVGDAEVSEPGSGYENPIELTQEPIERPTYFLILLYDENGNVIGAEGQPLPSGTFAAG